MAGFCFLGFVPRVAAAPKNGQIFQNWVIKCEGGEGVAGRCFAFQNIILTQSGQRLLTLAAGYLGPKGEPWILLTLPLGIYLPSGVALKVDNGRRFDAAVKICTAKGCEAGIPLDDVLLPALQAGLVARIAVLDGTARRQITVRASLKGFTAAFRTLK
jgi:invasion protein IalB